MIPYLRARPSKASLTVWLWAGSILLIGCGKSDTMAPVEGIVTIDGQPLTKGTIRFTPSAGRSARGRIQSDGTFTLGTNTDTDGALIGDHAVSVTAYAGEPVDTGEADSFDRPTRKPLVPLHYFSDTSSGLSFEVKPGKNHADFKLVSE